MQYTPQQIATMSAQELVNMYNGREVLFFYEGQQRKGKVIGGILNPMNHINIFRAFHVDLDGKKVSLHAGQVTFI